MATFALDYFSVIRTTLSMLTRKGSLRVVRVIHKHKTFIAQHSDRYGEDIVWGTAYYDIYQHVRDQGLLPKLVFGCGVIKPEKFNRKLADELNNLDTCEPAAKRQKA